MEYVRLNNTELNVSRICLGCWQFAASSSGGDMTWGTSSDTKQYIETVEAALEVGVNFFDTAEMYGQNRQSEKVLGRALQGKRRDAVIASKVLPTPNLSAEKIETSLLESLQALETDYLDLFYVHWPPQDRSTFPTIIAELQRQRSLGRIRYFAVSNFGAGDLTDFSTALDVSCSTSTSQNLQTGLTVNQLPYNLLWRGIEETIVPTCDKLDCSIICYSSLQQGLLTGKYSAPEQVPAGRQRTRHFNSSRTENSRHGTEGCEQLTFDTVEQLRAVSREEGIDMANLSLAWLLHRPRVQCVITGASAPDQIRQSAARIFPLSATVMEKLDRITQPLKLQFGGEADMWASTSRFR